MEDDTTYSSSVAGNIHPSDSQMNAITSILGSIDMIRSHVSRPFTANRPSRIANEGMRINIFSPSCIIALISDERTDEILFQRSLSTVRSQSG